MRTCSVNGCDKIHQAKGYCRLHYVRFSHHGDPLKVLPKGYNSNFYFTGQKHPAYKNGSSMGYQQKARDKARKLLGKICQICGSKKNICLHHIDGNPRNNDDSNWKILCNRCHRKIHRKYKTEAERLIAIKKSRAMSTERKRQEKLKMIPRGYIRSKQVMDILNISKERLRQIRNRLKPKIIWKKTFLYNVDYVMEYKDIKLPNRRPRLN